MEFGSFRAEAPGGGSQKGWGVGVGGQTHPSLRSNWVGLPWWLSGKEPSCQCRTHGFGPWSGKRPLAVEQLSLCAAATETEL